MSEHLLIHDTAYRYCLQAWQHLSDGKRASASAYFGAAARLYREIGDVEQASRCTDAAAEALGVKVR